MDVSGFTPHIAINKTNWSRPQPLSEAASADAMTECANGRSAAAMASSFPLPWLPTSGAVHFGLHQPTPPTTPTLAGPLVDPVLVPLLTSVVQLIEQMPEEQFKKHCDDLNRYIQKLKWVPGALMTDQLLLTLVGQKINQAALPKPQAEAWRPTQKPVMGAFLQHLWQSSTQGPRVDDTTLAQWHLTPSQQYPVLQQVFMRVGLDAMGQFKQQSPEIAQYFTTQYPDTAKQLAAVLKPEQLAASLCDLLAKQQSDKLDYFKAKVLTPLQKQLSQKTIANTPEKQLIRELIAVVSAVKEGCDDPETHKGSVPETIRTLQQQWDVPDMVGLVRGYKNKTTLKTNTTLPRTELDTQMEALDKKLIKLSSQTSGYFFDRYYDKLRVPPIQQAMYQAFQNLKIEEDTSKIDLARILGGWLSKFAYDGLKKKPTKAKEDLQWMSEFLALGGVEKFYKVGQIIQNRENYPNTKQFDQEIADALGPILSKGMQTMLSLPGQIKNVHVIDELSFILDDNLSKPLSEDDAVIAKELEKTKQFVEIDPNAIKTGTIAQVHKGRVVKNAENKPIEPFPVAVKIVKPKAVSEINEDIRLMTPLIKLIEKMFPDFDIEQQFNDFRSALGDETQMLVEGEHLNKARKAVSENPKLKELVYVPEAYMDYSDKRVLVMEWVDGIESFKDSRSRSNRKTLGKQFYKTYMSLLFDAGVCQTDPHPANLPYSSSKKKFVFLDAGSAQFVPKENRVKLAKLFMALFLGSPNMIKRELLEKKPSKKDKELYKKYREFSDYVDELFKSPFGLNADALRNLAKARIKAEQLGLNSIEAKNPLVWKGLVVAYGTAYQIMKDKKPGESKFSISLASILAKKVFATVWANDRSFVITSVIKLVLTPVRIFGKLITNKWRQLMRFLGLRKPAPIETPFEPVPLTKTTVALA